MSEKMIISKSGRQARNAGVLKKRSGLQFSMAISYIGVTVIIVLALEILTGISITMMLTNPSFVDSDTLRDARQKAQVYALEAAIQANGNVLPSDITFQPGQRSSIALPVDESSTGVVPYIMHNVTTPQQIALLVTPDKRVLASSYPARYPHATPVAQLLPEQQSVLRSALAGTSANSTMTTAQGRYICAAAPVWGKDRSLLGAVYVQIPLDKPGGYILLHFAGEWLVSSIVLPIILAPLGAIFGMITMRKLVRRIHRLVTATAAMADGDYAQRIPTSKHDEVGLLEQQFNTMAQRLGASVTAQRILAEQNARLEERARIARDLHDSIKQQVFAISMQLGAARSLVEQKPKVAKQHILEADGLAYEVRQELATWIQELLPLVFREKIFSQALREYVTNWSRQNTIAADLDVPDSGASLPLPIANAFARIVQEALSNVARHSQASHVKLSVAYEQDQVKLAISDNGRGFDMAQRQAASVGLQSMQERMAEIGGTLTIQSTHGAGTSILARCPFENS